MRRRSFTIPITPGRTLLETPRVTFVTKKIANSSLSRSELRTIIAVFEDDAPSCGMLHRSTFAKSQFRAYIPLSRSHIRRKLLLNIDSVRHNKHRCFVPSGMVRHADVSPAIFQSIMRRVNSCRWRWLSLRASENRAFYLQIVRRNACDFFVIMHLERIIAFYCAFNNRVFPKSILYAQSIKWNDINYYCNRSVISQLYIYLYHFFFGVKLLLLLAFTKEDNNVIFLTIY